MAELEKPVHEKTSSLPAGAMIQHFKVLRLLGKGGMGAVYLARDTQLGRKVALKLVHAEALGAPEAQEMFLQEARITARFNHPHIVTIFSVGKEGNTPFVALEYLEGQTLRERMDAERPALREALRIGRCIADALVEAHGSNVLHRDLKPQNVFLPKDGRLRVLDFGLAKLAGPGDAELSKTMAVGMEATCAPGGGGAAGAGLDQTAAAAELQTSSKGIKGTALYMAPEQWQEQTAVPGTDVWALGLILHELLGGQHPFAGMSFLQVCVHVTSADPVPPMAPAAVHGLPGHLVRLVERCLDKNPGHRPTAAEVSSLLGELLSGPKPREVVEESPFRGLLPFSEENHERFFGRSAEVETFVERLRSEPILPVVGPSGAGKSSFVLAGVVPRLRDQGDWLVVRMRPGHDPFQTLASRLTAAELGSDASLLTAVRSRSGEHSVSGAVVRDGAESLLVEELRHSPSRLALQLLDLCERRHARLLLFVDQLEEVFTLCADEATRTTFLQALCSAADDPAGPVRVVFTLRDDFLGRLALGAWAQEVLGRVVVLGVPRPELLTEILEKPLERSGFRFEDPELAKEMVRAVQGEQAALPLLQFVAQQLWERRDRERRLLTRAAYTAAGGVEGAIAQHTDEVMGGLAPEQEQIARGIILRLVTPEGTRGVVAQGQLLEGLGPGAEPVLERLTQARVILVRKGRGEADLELVHESLIRTWTRLRRWLEESQQERVFLAELDAAAALWERRGRLEEEVWQGPALADALRQAERCTVLPERAQRFLNAGLRRRRRQEWRRRAAVAGALGVLALIAAGSVAVSILFRAKERYAQQQRRTALERGAEAEREGARSAFLRGDVLEARAKLRSSLEVSDSAPGRALWWKLAQDPLRWRARVGDNVYAVAFSPDGRRVAAACQDQVVYQLDVQTKAMELLRGHGVSVLSVAHGPDPRWLATGAQNGSVRLWDLQQGGYRVLRGHPDAVRSVAFSPDGRLLATAGQDRIIRLWRVADGNLESRLEGHTRTVTSVGFGPDSRHLASSSADQTVRVWSVETGRLEHELKGHQGAVLRASFRSDGRLLASAGADGGIRIWEVATGRLQQVLSEHRGGVQTLEFSPDGQLLASGGADGTLRFFRVGEPRSIAHLAAHEKAVTSLAFSPDGQLLVTGGFDDTVRLWRVDRCLSTATVIPGHASGVVKVAFSPDGKRLASAGNDETVRLWDLQRGAVAEVLQGHQAGVSSVVFSPDGKWLASGSNDQTVRLWRPGSGGSGRVVARHGAAVSGLSFGPDGRLLASGSYDRSVRVTALATEAATVLKGEQEAVLDVAFSPDGQRVAAASDDRTVRLWDVATARAVRSFKGHTARVWGLGFVPDGRSIVSTGFDRTVRVWDLASGTGRVVGTLPARSYWLDVHPDGARVGLSSSDGVGRIVELRTGAVRELRGHRGELNDLQFSPDGRQAATAGDDGTVRLWETSSLRPLWRAPLLRRRPVRLLTHRGWTRLEQGDTGPADGEKQWFRAVSGRGRLASETEDRTVLCLLTDEDALEIWDPGADRLRLRRPIVSPTDVLAVPRGCVVLAADAAWLHTGEAPAQLLSRQATAIAWSGGEVLVVTGTQIIGFEPGGRERSRLRAEVEVTAISTAGGWRVAGFRNGSLELLPARAGQRKPGLQFESTPASPVLRIVPGPPGTVAAGFASGEVGLWALRNGTLLERFRLHGPVVHLHFAEGRLHAATELGDHRTLDLGVFYVPYCRLLRQVWQEVPVVWEDGLTRVRGRPRAHRCAR